MGLRLLLIDQSYDITIFFFFFLCGFYSHIQDPCFLLQISRILTFINCQQRFNSVLLGYWQNMKISTSLLNLFKPEKIKNKNKKTLNDTAISHISNSEICGKIICISKWSFNFHHSYNDEKYVTFCTHMKARRLQNMTFQITYWSISFQNFKTFRFWSGRTSSRRKLSYFFTPLNLKIFNSYFIIFLKYLNVL